MGSSPELWLYGERELRFTVSRVVVCAEYFPPPTGPQDVLLKMRQGFSKKRGDLVELFIHYWTILGGVDPGTKRTL